MPAPQTLQTARIQFISGIAFVLSATIFFLSNVISRVELVSMYRTAMFLSAMHYATALIQQLPVRLALGCSSTRSTTRLIGINF